MIAKIARKEFTEMLRDGRFRVAAAIIFTLLLVSLLMGWTHFRSVNAQHETAQRTTREQWLNQGNKGPHSAAHYGVYAFKPKMPLSLVDQGVDNYTGVAVWLEAHKQNDLAYRPAQDSTAVARFGELTAATVLQILLPLLIVLLTFASFAGEREQGTLRQVVSLGVKKRDLAFGKALGTAAALLMLLIPATIIGVAALAFASENGAWLASASRMVLIGISYLLYFAIFIAVSLTVSSLVRSSRVALVALLAFWIVNSLIAPRAAADAAKRVYPTPSAFEFTAAMESDVGKGINGHNQSNPQRQELQRQMLAKYNVNRVEDLPFNFDGIALQAAEDYGYTVFDEHYGEMWGGFERQNKLQQVASIIAPVLAIRSLSMGLAGSDFTQHRDFANAAENHRRSMIRLMNDDLTRNSRSGDTTYVAGRNLWETLPRFEYQAPGVGHVLANQMWSIVGLLGWVIVSVGAMLFATTRLKVD